MPELGVGIVGCGNISAVYLTNLARIPGLALRACADLRPEIAAAHGQAFGVDAVPVDTLLARADVDIVVNLTIPAAHAAVSLAALGAGKHVFSEKPLAIELEAGRRVIAEAERRGLLVGCAPDTFLGASGRLSRRLIDEGAIGRVVAGAAFVMSHGMEHWHPDPEFFYKPGGGPVLDMGPYYITALVNLIGPVARVVALTGSGSPDRLVSAAGPRQGQRIAVETPTTALALLQFASGAQVVFGASWDVWTHSHPPIELYGTAGSLRLPDPNYFGGGVDISVGRGDWTSHATQSLPIGVANWPVDEPVLANYRALGVADLAAAIRGGRPNHANGRLALHVLAVMDSILRSGETGAAIAIADETERPAPLAEDAAALLFPS